MIRKIQLFEFLREYSRTVLAGRPYKATIQGIDNTDNIRGREELFIFVVSNAEEPNIRIAFYYFCFVY